jgi:hypothetical protein
MNKKTGLFILLFAFCTTLGQSENIAKIKLAWNYSGSLHNVLKAIGDDYNLTFVYDTLKLQTITVKYYAFEENTLSKLFQEWKDQWNLYSYIEKARTVLISDVPLTARQRKKILSKQINTK